MTSSPAIADDVESGAAQRAAGSSFYLAMRILPRPQREAMFQIYRFCREVDDIADSDAPHAQRLQELASWRADIDAMYAGGTPPRVRELARCAADFSLAREDFLGVIEGMEMDAAEDIRAPVFDRLDLYCDRVASAVGRLSVRVFGMDRADGIALAHHLGRALQLTNILRDLDEDAGMGRLYLPRECIRAAGIDNDEPVAVLAHPALTCACVPVFDRARIHFAQADRIMARCPRASVRAPRIMAEVYRAMLEQMVRRGWAAPRERVRVGRLKLLWVVLRYALV
jgi:presqualene diphosphate synthase